MVEEESKILVWTSFLLFYFILNDFYLGDNYFLISIL